MSYIILNKQEIDRTLTPEEAQAYQQAIKAQQSLLIPAQTLEKSIGWLRKLEKNYPDDGIKALQDYLQEKRETRYLKKTLTVNYRTFSSLNPKERETWNCLPTTYENLKRLNDTARECYQVLKRNEKKSYLETHYQQLCLDLLMEDPSR